MRHLCLLTLVLILAAVPAIAAPPRHVNPGEVAMGRPDPKVLTGAYGLLAELLSTESYGNASRMLNLLLNASAAPDAAYVLRRFHEKLAEVNALFNLSRTYLEQAKELVLAGRVSDAAALLEEVARVLARANLTRADLVLAAREVQRRLGAQPIALLDAISELLAKHSSDAASLRALEGMRATELSVEVEPERAWVGSIVTVTGRLTSLREPLPGRRVTITVGGSIVGSVLTDEWGSFTYQLSLPYVYTRSLTVGAIYLPEADDARTFRPVSNSTEVLLLYETPRLSLRVEPSVALPGDRVRIEVGADQPNLQVEVRVFHEVRRLSLAGGAATIEVEVPLGVPEGVHRVLAASAPHGTVGPASAEAVLTVRRLDLELNVTAPSFIVVPFTARFTICVRGWNGTPLSYKVELSLAGSLSREEAGRTCTAVEVAAPALAPTGPARVEIVVTPLSPQHRPARAEIQVLIVNLLLVIPAVGLVAPLALAVKPRGTRAELSPLAPRQELGESPEEPYSLKLRSSDPVINEYLTGLRVVEKATGALLKPSHTISEYLRLVEPRLGRAAKPFAALSELAEARLYGGLEISLEVARDLREQLTKLLGEQP